ncbi:hypothetical protein RA307_17835 [Xanthobacteraceae bacterium Astr-EGSB]|nr:hypothetical protein [Xanthobacteraceae bacterium Astr-EGSB]
MTHRSMHFQPSDLPIDTLLPILLLGGAGYVAAFVMAWMTA